MGCPSREDCDGDEEESSSPNPSIRVLLCGNTVTLQQHRYYII
jgi:hypothetical protein